MGNLLSYADLLVFKTKLNKQRKNARKKRENERKRDEEGERKERLNITDKEDGRSQFNSKSADFKSSSSLKLSSICTIRRL